MGKDVIVAADGPGFLVNRCGRPFCGRGAAAAPGARGHARADRPHLPARRRLPDGPVRADGPRGHRRGLRGRQVVHRALLRRAALAPEPDPGAHGRRRAARPEERAAATTSTREDGPTGRTTPSRRSRAAATGTALVDPRRRARGRRPARARPGRRLRAPRGRPGRARGGRRRARRTPRRRAARRCSCSAPPAASLARGEQGAVGFHLLPPLDEREARRAHAPARRPSRSRPRRPRSSSRGSASLTEWVEDAPGLVLGRIVCQLVNEAAFAIGEGVGSADDVDAGLTLGLSHPRGAGRLERGDRPRPRARGRSTALWEERREERYRAAPLLRRAAALGRSLRD